MKAKLAVMIVLAGTTLWLTGCTTQEMFTIGDAQEDQLGYEILNTKSRTEIVAWASSDITLDQFNEIRLPNGWRKNQPRLSEMDDAFFDKSPSGSGSGDFVDEEHFGYIWRHVATVIESEIEMDTEGLLSGARVSKDHTLQFNGGRDVIVLISPEDEVYIRVTRDAGRTSETPTLPAGWRLGRVELVHDLVTTLPNPAIVIRAENEDSFQGPVMDLDISQVQIEQG